MFLALLRAHFNPRYARAKMILSRAKNIFMPANVNPIVILNFNIIHITLYAQYSTLMLLTVVRCIVNLQRGRARPFAPDKYLSDCLSLFRNPAKMWQQFQCWCSKTNSIMGNSLEENLEYFLASHSRIL